MIEQVLQAWVHFFKPLGLNYSFVLDPGGPVSYTHLRAHET